MTRSRVVGLILCGTSFLSACKENPVDPLSRVTIVRIQPFADTLRYIGAHLQMSALALDANNTGLRDVPLRWASTDATIATVDETGRVTAAGVGRTEIIVEAGYARDTAHIVVEQVVAKLLVNAPKDTLEAIGEQLQLTLEAYDSADHPMPAPKVTWLSRDTSVARVDSRGLVTARRVGTADIVAETGTLVGGQRLFVFIYPALRISVRMTGGGRDRDGSIVAVDSTPFTVVSDTTLLIPKVAPGGHSLSVGGLAAHCRALPDRMNIQAIGGDTAQADFTVRCVGDFAFDHWDGIQQLGFMSAEGDVSILVTDGYVRYSAAWSPDGSQIAYARAVNGNTDIYVMDLATRVARRLTNHPDAETSPSWSPDGGLLAFKSESRTNTTIFSMSSEGTSLIKLVDTYVGQLVEGPLWSPVNDWIAYVTPGPHGRNPIILYLVRSPTEIIAMPSNTTTFDHQFAWSRDGEWIAVVSGGIAGAMLQVVKAGETARRTLVPLRQDAGQPAWSPDDSAIAYIDQVNSGYGVYTVKVDGQPSTLLTPDLFLAVDPTWIEDEIILFSGSVGGVMGIFAVKPDGSERQLVLQVSPATSQWRPLPRPH